MRLTSITELTLVVWATLLCGIASADAFIYETGRLSFLDYPGARSTGAHAINNDGTIIGRYVDAAGIAHGFIRRNGAFTTLDFPGAIETDARGINDLGDIVGGYFDGIVSRTFVYTAGGFTTLSVPGAIHSVAGGVNDSGAIVGSYSDASFLEHAFLYTDGVFRQIDFPGATHTYARAINNAGVIVGGYKDATGFHGFILVDGDFRSLDVPDAVGTTEAIGISNLGVIVGTYSDGVGGWYGFVYADSAITKFVVPHAQVTHVWDVNDAGTMVGEFVPATIDVDIDIKPGDDTNCVNLNKRGVIPVAIFGAADFDVSQVDIGTLSLQGLSLKVGKSGKYVSSVVYSNGDNYPDLVVQFQDSDNWLPPRFGVVLTGRLSDRSTILGRDLICVVP